MAEEKKPGLLKRIFSFGFGKKKEAEPEPAPDEVEEVVAEPEVDDATLKQEEEQRQAAEQEKKEKAEAKAKREAEKEAAKQAETEKKKQKKAEENAAKAAEAKKAKEEAAKAAKEKKAKEKAEAAEKQKEEKAKEKAETAVAAKAEKEAAKRAAEEEAERIKAEEAEEAARLEAEAAEKAEAEAAEKAAEEEKKEQEKPKGFFKSLFGKKDIAPEPVLRQAQDEDVVSADTQDEDTVSADTQDEEIEQQADEVPEDKAIEEVQDEEPEQEPTSEVEEPAVEDAETVVEVEEEPEPEPQEAEDAQQGWFKRLRKGLARSSSALTENITAVFTKKKLDDDTLQDLEDILIQADLGVETAMNITDALSAQRYGKDVTDEEVREIMAEEITKVMEPVALPLELDLDHQPHVILVVGVNGSGKTTTIGKLSAKLDSAGYSTMLVAGDTFRAAAIEQLHIWGDRTNAEVISRDHGSDAAGLAFDAYAEAKEKGKDVVLMDTAGRLQNKKELMDELEKIIRVLKKQDENAPHTVLLTLDATTGQNALNQVEIFKDVAGVNGLVMTKLDGTARGGILVSISAKHKLPIYFVGVGEQVEDLEPFEAEVFAKAIAGLE